jgi:hypothetical protein
LLRIYAAWIAMLVNCAKQ